MPAYYFHITFELYPSRSSPETTYTPPPQTDIFTSSLPSHGSSPWGIPTPSSAKSSFSKSPVSSSDVNRLTRARERPPAPRRFSHRAQQTFPELHDSPVPIVKPPKRPAHRRTQSFAPRDWRFDTISIQSIDMNPSPSEEGTIRALKQPSHATSSGGLATKGKFIPSDLKDTEVGWGVVHLYREGEETPGLYDEVKDGAFNEEDCTTLCILAVPSYMTPSDLLGFMGEQTREHVTHFRLVRTSRANKYMVLMKFREAKKAREWRKEWNGKTFNSMEPEYCHVVFVKSISFQTSSDGTNHDPSSYPDLTNDPFTPASTKEPTAPLPSTVDSHSLTTKPFAPPTPSLVELPTCPVCLERMDETTGLLTILCQHVFHCACLEKWRGSGCPVCRYTQNDAFASLRDGDTPDNECSVCGSTANLWICLICGNIGCGRYDSAHAFAHYEATSHTYAMDVVSQHVWDYAGDGYVHRLIQNKSDGKLVDLPASHTSTTYAPSSMTGYSNDTVPREKLDNMGMEYAYLLTSQLESQRAYFEEQVERAADKAAKAASSADDANRAAASLSASLARLESRHADAQASIAALERDNTRNAARAASAQDLARSLTKQFKEEQTINEALMTRIAFLEGKVKDADDRAKAAEEQKRDLEEQNRDLSFFISGQEKLKEMQGNEVLGLQEGEVEAASVEVGEKGTGRRKGKGKKKN
ncbi:RING-10 protein [Aaosphaeria arxii CBS 175.79]|uniref:RING-10 protein n=1 Tax=Aaosphaeria arxii CBS 175.79 TaxID=1450172 RepID=A0A6A5Y677_9PLEO|nr:RING-10 protein [Aaosphaeria arxii CBS 175.79]KAF2020537.1 RING-10 protein [Aaosphaeria arxii CBS 175.79]